MSSGSTATSHQDVTQAIYGSKPGNPSNVIHVTAGPPTWPPLMTAAFHGRLDVVQNLLSQGAEVSAKSNKVRRLHYLLSHLGSFLALCSKAVDPNLNSLQGQLYPVFLPMASSSCPHALHM